MSWGVVVALFLFLAWVVGTIWVFTDATVNSSQSAILWGLVAFFGGITGVFLYVLLGRDGSGPSGRTRERRNVRRGPPSHVCDSCGEEYYTDRETEIGTCRSCGGIHVQRR